jgi:hypothetical protein
MRISLSDSLLNGFKKWSDAQHARKRPAVANLAGDETQRRGSATATVAAGDAFCDGIG